MVFSPLYLVVINWVFPFDISLLSDWILLWIWEHLTYVLHMNTRGDNGVSYWFTWYMFWHSTHGFQRWHWGNLCIGVDASSCLCFSGRNLGALFEVLCVGLNIMNLNLLWFYFSTNSWLDQSERIASCYFSTNSRIDWSERIALRWFRTLQTIYIFCAPLIGTREWFFIAIWGIIICSNYVSIVERLHQRKYGP